MQIKTGIIPGPKKVVIYGPEGIGKSTFASKFPDPLFIDTEGSTSAMDVARTDPAPTSWNMLTAQVEYIRDHPDICKTLVIDTADWAEKLCIEQLCAEKQIKGIEDIGYGKGYVYVAESFGKLLNLLGEVKDKGINVVLTAHAWMRKFEQPDELGAYDRWELKLSKKVGPLVKEWSDMLLFANYKTIVVNVDNQGALKGKNKAQGGKRVMYTTHHACWDAKNRYGLPDEMDFTYDSIAHLFARTQASVETKTEEAPVQEPKKTKKTKEQPVAPVPDPQPEPQPTNTGVIYVSDPNNLPESLKQLMEENHVHEWDIQNVVSIRGYYPPDVKIQDYDPAFIAGVLVGAWPQVLKMIQEARNNMEIPFN